MGRVLLTHPLGSPFAAHAALGLRQAGLLSEVMTTFCFKKNSLVGQVLSIAPSKIRSFASRELERRAWIMHPDIRVTQFPAAEILRMSLVKSKLYKLLGISYQALADRVFRRFDENVAKSICTERADGIIYAYEDSALQSFKRARELGFKCIYDLPIMYHKDARKIEQEEAKRFPEYANSLFAALDSEEKSQRKEQELRLADRVIVASSATLKSLTRNGYPENKISLVPYGAPLHTKSELEKQTSREFKVLFVGRVGPRKGVHYLLEAWRLAKLNNASLTLVGINDCPLLLKNLPSSVRFTGSIPQAQLAKYYQEADLLVLPSIIEGFGMVLLEAMAHGVPILATENTAGPDLVENNKEGFIVPIRDAKALAEKLTWCAENRNDLIEMGRAAKVVAERLSWDRYGSAIAEIAGKLLEYRN